MQLELIMRDEELCDLQGQLRSYKEQNMGCYSTFYFET